MSDISFLDHVLEQLEGVKGLKTRAMFGGHGRAALLRAPVQDSAGGSARGAGAQRESWRPASQRDRHV